MNKKDIIDAWAWIRKNNQAIPDDVLDLMKDAAIEKIGKEVKGVDWEIVSFIEKENEVDEGDDPYILPVSSIPKCYKLEDYLKTDSCYSIHSVRRLSDGEVFSVGDEICFDGFGQLQTAPIEKFEIDFFDNKRISAYYGPYGLGLERWRKPLQRTPLFKTEDGVDIFEGGECWIYDSSDDFGKVYQWVNVVKSGMQSNYKYFSTQQKAKEYELMSTICLSVTDVINCPGSILVQKPPSITRYSIPIEDLKELVKQKLNKQ